MAFLLAAYAIYIYIYIYMVDCGESGKMIKISLKMDKSDTYKRFKNF